MWRLLRNCQLFAQLSTREKVWFMVLFVGSGIAQAALLTRCVCRHPATSLEPVDTYRSARDAI